MSLERSTQPVTRSTAGPEEPSTLFTLGKYYSIRADTRDYEGGFCIAKATMCKSTSFAGVYMEETKDSIDDRKVLYKQTKETGQFDAATMFSVVMSSTTVAVDIITIDRSEVEEILYAANIDS